MPQKVSLKSILLNKQSSANTAKETDAYRKKELKRVAGCLLMWALILYINI